MKTILPNCSVKKRGGEEREPEGGRERKTERERGEREERRHIKR